MKLLDHYSQFRRAIHEGKFDREVRDPKDYWRRIRRRVGSKGIPGVMAFD